jgi:hypothetical protein
MLPEPIAAALRLVCAALSEEIVTWAVTGSVGLALQGVPVGEVNDLDLQTDATGWAAVQQRLSAYVTRPVMLSGTATIRSHFGRLDIEGVQVEIIGGAQHRRPDGTWSAPVDPADHLRVLPWEGRLVPVLDAAYEAGAYRRLGRLARAAEIEAWLSQPQQRPMDG